MNSNPSPNHDEEEEEWRRAVRWLSFLMWSALLGALVVSVTMCLDYLG